VPTEKSNQARHDTGTMTDRPITWSALYLPTDGLRCNIGL